jgi:hypothetical protein
MAGLTYLLADRGEGLLAFVAFGTYLVALLLGNTWLREAG